MTTYVHVEHWFFTQSDGSRHFLKNVDEARKKVREGKPVFALTSTGTLTPPIQKFLLNGRKFQAMGGAEYSIV